VLYKRHYLVPLHGVSTAVLSLLKFQSSYYAIVERGEGPNYEVDSELIGLMFRPILEATFRIPQLHVLVIDDVLMGNIQ
jgi:hypothetical protein